jgi:hypothetical protein
MSTKKTTQIDHQITPQTIESFLAYENNNGASANMNRRFRSTLNAIYDFLPEDKYITKERLLDWRKDLEDKGYASVTILNYVKYLNRYLDFFGCSDIRFNKGRSKDITGMTFGYLTAIEPTGEKERKNIIWTFRCKCGKTVNLPATRVLTGNTLSCGCLMVEHLKASKKYFEGTSLTQSLDDTVESKRARSGYIGVMLKNEKWLAYIQYKGVRYSLGCYYNIQDAIKARARAKELVIADAQGLLDFYTELEKMFPELPSRHTVTKIEFPETERKVNNTPASAAKRNDNTTGYIGVNYRKGKWEAKICYQGVRYMLGRFEDIDQAITARKAAEADLKADPEKFASEYAKKCRTYHIK